MKWRAYAVLVGIAVVMGVCAVVASLATGDPIKDPDGSLGPSWLRMPGMLLLAFLIDVVPRTLWRARREPGPLRGHLRRVVVGHWTRERMVLVTVGIVSFYVTYVSYRNLKNLLPVLGGNLRDPVLHHIDKLLMLGHEPAVVLHAMLGDGIAAHLLAIVYLVFLPVSPGSLIVFLVWSRTIRHGLWFTTAQCIAWALGTASYYLIPTLGPAFSYPWLYTDVDVTGAKTLQDALYNNRVESLYNPLGDSIQSVAGFASLHVGIVLTLAMVVQYTARRAWVRRTMWVYFALTVVSTLYFGWHYIADDLAGVVIALIAVWGGGMACGFRFDRRGRLAGPPEDAASEQPEPVPSESRRLLAQEGHRR